MKTIPRDQEALQLLLRYLRMIQTDMEPTEAALRQAIVNHIHDFVALVVGTSRNPMNQGKGTIAAARLAAVVEYIRKQFTDPALSLTGVAHQHDISPRYLQELLEQSGTPFVARVNELRLKRALALLKWFPDRPVTEIAAQAGFSNVSHFNRLFRQRFGDSPSGFRSRT